MNVKELRIGMANVEVEAELTEKKSERDVVTKFGKHLRVSNCIVTDETGSIGISLWQDAIDLVNVGDQVKITGASVHEYKGTPQLNLGREGRIFKK